MARIKPTADGQSNKIKGSAAATPRTKKAAAPAAKSDGPERRRLLSGRRVQALVIIVAAAGLAWAGQTLWRRVEPLVINRDRYLVPAEAIIANQPPEWIVCDVRSQVISTSGLDRRLSILDPGFAKAIENAFTLHPWVERVVKIEKSVPAAVRVELEYRKPVAVIETPLASGFELLPVDARAIHLPAGDVPLIRRNYLPRITGIVGQPPAGQRWDDPRVVGAVDLAAQLADVWDGLHLAEIVPSARPEVQGERRYFVYDIVAQGGTRIVWGAPPVEAAPGEAEFATKKARLQQCDREYGPFDSVKSPDVVDIRRGISITPRQVKKETPEKSDEPRQVRRPMTDKPPTMVK